MSGRCRVCVDRPAAVAGAGYCFGCWPGGPVAPPPCLRCASTVGYWSAGLCEECHPARQRRARPCRDCLAWGLHTGRACGPCASWSAKYATGDCVTCGRTVPVDPRRSCRLCHVQRRMVIRDGGHASRVDLRSANRLGQQLWLADAFSALRKKAPRPGRRTTAPIELRPVDHRQLVLFEVAWDIEAGLRLGFPPPRDPVTAEALRAFVRDHAARHGWKQGHTERVQRAVRILLGTQDTPGAPIRAGDVVALAPLKLGLRTITDVLAAAGMLEDDRVPGLVRWFEGRVVGLPEAMQAELRVWLDVRRHGSTTPPRFRPRAETTIRSQLGFAMPALRQWAGAHASLREVSRDDVRAVLPPSGSPRSSMLQGLRSIFRVLKARQLVFVNPTTHMSVPTPNRPAPAPVDLTLIREALDSDDPARAALAALAAFHAVGSGRLCAFRLTDLRDGRLHLDGHVVLLAEPVRDRLAAYLDHRAAQWPDTANPHFFVNYRSAIGTRPVTPWWVRKRLGASVLAIRQDRILDEAHASGGDVRLLCDLFGLSVAGAYRYTATVEGVTGNDTGR